MDGEKSKNTTELQDLGNGSGSDAPEVVTAAANEYGQDATILYKQTRTRRLFSTAQLVCFTMLYMGTWTAVLGSSYAVFQNGGIAAWLFGYIVVSVGVLAQVISFCEMASIQPVAGAQYYWTHYLAPPSMKLFLTWVQGWCTWLGYVAMLAGYISGHTMGTIGTLHITYPDLDWTAWQKFLFILAWLALITLINLYAFRLVPWLELLIGIVNVLAFFVELVVIWVVAPRNDPAIFVDTSDGGSGWDSYFVRFNIGTLSLIWLFIAFEGPVHMAEETRHPRKAVPQALFWGMATSFGMGFVMIFTYGMALPPVDYILNAYYPTPAVLEYAVGSQQGTLAMMAFHLLKSSAGLVSSLSSTSRLTWAWARDGGLPSYFALVDKKTRIPFRAVVGTSFIILLLLLLNLSEEAMVAFNALIALSSLGMYASYAIVFACILYARWAGTLTLSVWNVGVFGPWINAFALIYTIYEMIWLPFPSSLPVTASNMNYAGPVFGAVLIGAITHWFFWAKRNWSGPNKAIVEIVLKNDEDLRHSQK